MLSILNNKKHSCHKKKYVQEFSKSLNVFETNIAQDGIIKISPKRDIKEHDRAVEFLNITQNLNKEKVNYIISKEGIFHICNLQR